DHLGACHFQPFLHYALFSEFLLKKFDAIIVITPTIINENEIDSRNAGVPTNPIVLLKITPKTKKVKPMISITFPVLFLSDNTITPTFYWVLMKYHLIVY